MWLRSDHRGVSVFVRGEFVAPRQWLIRANVSCGAGIDTVVGVASRRRTLGELWQGIAYESRIGRHLGALAVRVIVDGDPDIASELAAIETPRTSIAPTGDGDAKRIPEVARLQRAAAI